MTRVRKLPDFVPKLLLDSFHDADFSVGSRVPTQTRLLQDLIVEGLSSRFRYCAEKKHPASSIGSYRVLGLGLDAQVVEKDGSTSYLRALVQLGGYATVETLGPADGYVWTAAEVTVNDGEQHIEGVEFRHHYLDGSDILIPSHASTDDKYQSVDEAFMHGRFDAPSRNPRSQVAEERIPILRRHVRILLERGNIDYELTAAYQVPDNLATHQLRPITDPEF